MTTPTQPEVSELIQHFWATFDKDGKPIKCIVRKLDDNRYIGYILPEWYPEFFANAPKPHLYAEFMCSPDRIVLGDLVEFSRKSAPPKTIYAGSLYSPTSINEIVGWELYTEITIDGQTRSMREFKPNGDK